MAVENRVPIYGKNSDNEEKRAFDIVMKNGQPCFETKDRYGNKVWTAGKDVLAAYRRLCKRASM